MAMNPDVMSVVGGSAPKADSKPDILQLINTVANLLVGLIAAISIFFIIRGAFEWMNGDAEAGKKTVLYATIGLVVAITSFALLSWFTGAGLWLNNSLK